MKQLQSLSHTVWECKYHIVWIPKYRKKVLYGKIREELVGVFHELANRRGCKILEGHLCVDHVHMLLSIPPKYGVAEVVGYLKGKSAIEIAKHFERVRKITGASFWVLATVVVGGAYYGLEQALLQPEALWLNEFTKCMWPFMDIIWPLLGGFVLFGVAIGGVGCASSIRKHLKV